MKNKLFASVLALAVSTTLCFSGSGEWIEDHDKALEKAKQEKKMVLMDFTGSDWCGWCIKLDKEVFSTPAFQEYAKKNLVLMEVDFPRNKEQSDELKQQNQQLQKKYSIRGYPTIIVLNSEGDQLGELGYMEGGPDAFIAELEKLQKKS